MTHEPGNPSGRIVLLQTPQAPPGQCGICGKSQDDNGFVDAQLSYEFYGALIFCSECIGEMARLYDYIPLGEYDKLEEELDDLRKEVAMLRAAVLQLEDGMDALSAERLRSRDYKPEHSADVPTEPRASELLKAVDNVEGPDDSTAVESANEPGPNDVRNTTESSSTGGATDLLGV